MASEMMPMMDGISRLVTLTARTLVVLATQIIPKKKREALRVVRSIAPQNLYLGCSSYLKGKILGFCIGSSSTDTAKKLERSN